jgi:hypothetical protein
MVMSSWPAPNPGETPPEYRARLNREQRQKVADAVDKGRPVPAESRLQASIVKYFDAIGLRRDCLVFSVPNEGRRSRVAAGILKSMGMLPGVADLVIVAPGGRCHFLEVKTARGKLSSTQQEFRRRCRSLDVPHAIVRSLDDVGRALSEWGLGPP